MFRSGSVILLPCGTTFVPILHQDGTFAIWIAWILDGKVTDIDSIKYTLI